MTALSVVVANRIADPAEVAPALAALDRELDADDQLIWVDRAGLDPAGLGRPVEAVTAPAQASRAVCYGLGLGRARLPMVAFTDSTTLPDAGWRSAAGAALGSGATVVGGPVLPAFPPSSRNWAGFLVDYGPHAVPPYTSATGDVSGNNVAYRRGALPTGSGPIWKSEVNMRVAGQDAAPVVVPGMSVTVRRTYGWRDLGILRARSGAQYARIRAAGWPLLHRVPAALACSALPGVALARLWRAVGADATLRRRLAASLPWVVLALVSWSVGEALGYLVEVGDDGVW